MTLSTSTMERAHDAKKRRRQATHPPRTIPELVTEKPNRVWP
jgi:putative transposase